MQQDRLVKVKRWTRQLCYASTRLLWASRDEDEREEKGETMTDGRVLKDEGTGRKDGRKVSS